MAHGAPAGVNLKANFVRSKDAFPPDGLFTPISRADGEPKISPTFGGLTAAPVLFTA